MTRVVSVLIVIGLAAFAHGKTPRAVTRAIEALAECRTVDEAHCQSIPVRLANYKQASVKPLGKAFAGLSPAGQILGVMALQRIKHDVSTRLLVKLARKSNYMVRTLVLSALGDRAGRAVDKALIAALSQDNPAVRAAAADALGKSERRRNLKRVVPALIKAAGDREVSVKVAAIGSLGLLGHRSATPVVVKALGSRHAPLKRTALFSLRFLNDKRSVPDVIEVLRVEDGVIVRDAGTTLERITGMAFGVDYELWKGWWAAQEEDR